MPTLESRVLGRLEWTPEAVITFPEGLPAFEDLRGFLLVERRRYHPFLFLQSVEDPDLCLPAVPASAVDPDYDFALSPEVDIVLEAGGRLWLAVVVITGQGPPTANLLAPIVINPDARRAVQVVRADARYSYAHPLVTQGELACS